MSAATGRRRPGSAGELGRVSGAGRLRGRSGGRINGRSRGRFDGDGGWISIEFVGMFGLFLVSLLLVLQGAAFSYTMAQANGAARAAARASSLGQSGVQAARDAVNPSLRPVVADGGSSGYAHRWRVTLRVAQVVPMMPRWSVTRSATMPATEPIGG